MIPAESADHRPGPTKPGRRGSVRRVQRGTSRGAEKQAQKHEQRFRTKSHVRPAFYHAHGGCGGLTLVTVARRALRRTTSELFQDLIEELDRVTNSLDKPAPTTSGHGACLIVRFRERRARASSGWCCEPPSGGSPAPIGSFTNQSSLIKWDVRMRTAPSAHTSRRSARRCRALSACATNISRCESEQGAESGQSEAAQSLKEGIFPFFRCVENRHLA